jgi:hypothetical protein
VTHVVFENAFNLLVWMQILGLLFVIWPTYIIISSKVVQVKVHSEGQNSSTFLLWRSLLWSKGQSSWLQIRRSGFVFRRYQIFCEVVVLELGPLSLDRLCGLVVSVPGYRSRGLGSIPGVNRFSEKLWIGKGVHSASWLQLRSYLKEKVTTPV